MADEQSGGSPGPSTDRHNDPVIDPTFNVLRDIAGAVTRLDDLRKMETVWRDKLDDLRDKMDTLRSQHIRDMRKAEADRIDAIRSVDVGNVQRAAEVQATQALALANQVVATATALETKLGATVAPLQTRIDDLTRVQYEGVGSKTQVVETQARGGSTGLWIGIAVATLTFLTATVIGAATLLVLLLR